MTTANVNVTKVLLKRGNTVQNNNYTGVSGELTIDTQLKTLRVHDGVTAGGNVIVAGGVVGSYSNTNTAAYLSSQSITSANIGAFQTLANANAATQTTEINSLRSNITAANAAIITLQSNAATQQTQINLLNANVTAANALIPNLIAISSNIIPSANVTYSLGSSAYQWKDLWVSNNTIYIGNVPLTVSNGNLLVNGSLVTGSGSGTDDVLRANVGAYQTFANSNAATQATSINTVNANIGAYQTFANSNAATQSTAISTLQTQVYANANVNTYLSSSIIGSLSTSGNLTVGGNLVVNGNSTIINTTTYTIEDNILQIADGNPADTLDLGFVGHRTVGATLQHTGLVRDASAGEWRLFSNVTAQPGTTVDFTNAVYDNLVVGNISANIVKNGRTWTFGTGGNLTVPASGTITAPINQEFQLQARDTNSVLRNEINLDPNNGTYMSVWSDGTTSFSTGAGSWATASWNNESGLGAARFTDAQALQNFWTTGIGSLGLPIEASINGGARTPNVFYDGNNGEQYGVTLGLDAVPPGGQGTTVPITSLVFYYQTQSKINIDRDGGEILVDAQSMDLDLRTTNILDLRAGENLNLRGLGAYPVRIYTNGTTHMWEFDTAGSLTLPSQGKIYGIGAPNDRYGYMSWTGNTSGDGSGYNTMRLVPDQQGLEDVDTYIILDPAYDGQTGNIHIRAGGTRDNSLANLYLGGANSHVKIGAGLNPPVTVKANNNSWTFGNTGTTTFPTNISINYSAGNVQFPRIIADSGKSFSVQAQGNIGSAALAWTVNPDSAGQYAAVAVTKGGGDNLAKVLLSAQSDSGDAATAKTWVFNQTGTTQFPNSTILAPVSASITMQSDQYSQLMWENANLTVAPNMAINSNFYVAQNNATLDIGYRDGSSTQLIKSWYWNVDGIMTLPTAGRINFDYLSISSDANVSAFYAPAGNVKLDAGIGDAQIVANSLNDSKTWTFGTDANLTLPQTGYLRVGTGIVARSLVASPAPVISGFSSISAENFRFQGNGVNILSTVAASSTYSNANVVANLANYATNIVSTANVTASYFIGSGAALTNLSYNNIGNIIGTSSNVSLIAGSYTWTFDNTGNLVIPTTSNIIYANGTVFTSGTGGGTTYSNANVVSMLAANTAVFVGNTNNVNTYSLQSNITQVFIGGNAVIASGNAATTNSVSLMHNMYFTSNGTRLVRNTGAGVGLLSFDSTGFTVSGLVTVQTANSAPALPQWIKANTSGLFAPSGFTTSTITASGTVAVNAATGITTNQTTFPLVNQTATTILFGQTATTINMGSSTIGGSGSNVFVGNAIGTSSGNLTVRAFGTYNSVNSLNSNGGYGNTTYTNIAVTGGSGTGMIITMVGAASGYLSSATVTNPGTGYQNGETITIPAGNPTGSLGGSFVIGNYNPAYLGQVLADYNFGFDGNLILPGNLAVPRNATITGNLGVNGTNVTVLDSILGLHTFANLAAWTADDGRDIGIRMHYYSGTDKAAFLGLENTTKSLQFIADATETASNVTGTFGNVQFGSLLLSNSTASTNTITGALVVTGGGGFGGNVFANNIIANVTPAVTSTPATGVGYIGMPQNATGSATLTIADAGKHIYVTSASQTITIPANSSVPYPVGTTIAFIAGPSATTVSIAITTDTMYLAGTGTTGTRTLAAYGMATAVKVASTTWYINGSGLT